MKANLFLKQIYFGKGVKYEDKYTADAFFLLFYCYYSFNVLVL